MKKIFIVVVSALMMISLASCKKTIIGEKADKSASGLYCYETIKCKLTIKGDALAYRCPKALPASIKWNDKVTGYTGTSGGQKFKLLYADNKFFLYNECNEAYAECQDAKELTRCK